MSPQTIGRIGVVGAGAMGAGIAQTALCAGLDVVLSDSSASALANAREQLHVRMARLVEKGQLHPRILEELDSHLKLSSDLQDFATADVVIEAIVEAIEPKQALFAALEKCVRADAILATNTSSLSVAAIARGCERRERVIGMHFFNPVPLMKLVEIIRAPETSQAAVDAGLALADRLGKTAVEVRDVPGFLVNLIGRAYATEALHLYTEGVASVEAIDRIMKLAAGFRMGPFELMDLTGIDVNYPASMSIFRGFQFDPRLKTTIAHEALFNAGRFGRKTNKGFYGYPGKEAAPTPAPVGTATPRVFIATPCADFDRLMEKGLASVASPDQAELTLITVAGEDAASAAARLNLSAARTVAIDFIGLSRNFLTVMSPVTGAESAQRAAQYLRSLGYELETIKDSPGFVAPRVLAMVANLGCEVAQLGIGAPRDIDTAMKLAQNYPRGPLEWADVLGPHKVHEILSQIQLVTGSDRYRPSLWLRRRAQLGLSVYETE